MIELLILYILNFRDRTVYSIRREIIDCFGVIFQPSLGAIHPALKRLLEKDAVKYDKKFSEGGKKSTFYSLSNTAKKTFKEIFFEDISQNPITFLQQLYARLLTISLLDKSDRVAFLEEMSKTIEIQKIEIEKALENPYVKYDDWQKAVISHSSSNINSLSQLIERLKTY